MESKAKNLRKNPNKQKFKRQHIRSSGKETDVGKAEVVSWISYVLIFTELKGTTGSKQSKIQNARAQA